MNPDLDKMSVVELKALCFDQIALLEQSQKNIQIINQKIAEKSQAKEEPKEKDVVKDK